MWRSFCYSGSRGSLDRKPALGRRRMGDVHPYHRNAVRPVTPSKSIRLGPATPAPLVAESVADDPAGPVGLVPEPPLPVTVPDATPANVELPASKKIPPVGEAGAVVTTEGGANALAAAVLEAVELETLVSK